MIESSIAGSFILNSNFNH